MAADLPEIASYVVQGTSYAPNGTRYAFMIVIDARDATEALEMASDCLEARYDASEDGADWRAIPA